MNILIIDDDIELTSTLKSDLFNYYSNYYNEINFYIYNSPYDVTRKNIKYEFAFLDIDLPKSNGIDIAQELILDNCKTTIIFISSHNNLIHDTLIVNPFYFIRKSHYKNDMNIFFNLNEKLVMQKKYINLNYNREINRLNCDDIIYIESQVHKLIIHTREQTYYDNRSLKEMTDLLADCSFTRIHKSYLINMSFLTNYKNTQVILDNYFNLKIGRSYKEDFEKKYIEYLIK